MYYFYCTVGTETAAGPVTAVKVETTYITVNWPQPKYSPVKIEAVIQQSLLCKRRPDYTQQVCVSPDCLGLNFTNMKPGSVCKVNYAVIYNPSESDRGVDYSFETLSSSKAYVYLLRNTKCLI